MDFQDALIAINQGNVFEVQKWIDGLHAEVDADVDPQFGAAALHWACNWGQVAVARLLIANGASPNFPNAYGATPLHWACKNASLDLVKLLVERGADRNLTDALGSTPIDIARQARAMEILEFLCGGSVPEISFGSPSKETDGDKRKMPVLTHQHIYPNPKGDAKGGAALPDFSQPSPAYSDTSAARYGTGPPGTSEFGAISTRSALQNSGMIPALQRAKVKLEVELKHSQKAAEALRNDLGSIQIEKLQLESKLKVANEIRKKADVVQREKTELEAQLRQAIADREAVLARIEEQGGGLNGAKFKELEEKLALLEIEHKGCFDEKHKLRTTVDRTRQDTIQQIATKDKELDALRATVHTAQAEVVRLQQMDAANTRAIADLKLEVAGLHKRNGLLEADAATLPQVQEALAAVQKERARLDQRVTESEREIAALKTDLTVMQGHAATAMQRELEKTALEGKLRKVEWEFEESKNKMANMERQMEATAQRMKELMQLELTLRETERELENAKAKVASVQRQQEQVEAALADQAKVSEDLRSDIQRAQQTHRTELTAAECAADELRRELQVLNVELAAERNAHARVQTELDATRTELETVKVTLARERNQDPSGQENSAAAYTSLQRDFDNVQKEKSVLAEQLFKAESTIANLRANHRASEVLANENRTLALEIERLTSVVNKAQEEQHSATKALESSDAKVVELTNQLAEQTRRRTTAEAELEQLKHYENEFMAAEKRRMELEVQYKMQQLSGDELKAHFDAAQTDKAVQEEQLRAMDDLRQAYEGLHKEHEVLREKHKHAEWDLERTTVEQKRREEQIKDLHERERNALNTKIEALEAEKLATQAEMKSLVEQLMQAQQRIGEMTQTHIDDKANTLMQVQSKLDQIQKSKTQAETERAELEATCRQKEQVIQQLQSLIEMMNADKLNYTQHLNSKDTDLDRKDQEIKQMTALAVELKSRLKGAEAEIERVQQTYRNDMEAAQQQFQANTERLKEMANEQLRTLQHEAQNEVDGAKVKQTLLEKQKQGLELQIKALQDHIATLMAESNSRRDRGDRSSKLFSTKGLRLDAFDLSMPSNKEKTLGGSRNEPPRPLWSTFPGPSASVGTGLSSISLNEKLDLDPNNVLSSSKAGAGATAAAALPPIAKGLPGAIGSPFGVHRLPKASTFQREQRALLLHQGKDLAQV